MKSNLKVKVLNVNESPTNLLVDSLFNVKKSFQNFVEFIKWFFKCRNVSSPLDIES